MGQVHARGRPFPVAQQAPVGPWWKLEGNESHHSRATFAHVAPAAPTTTNVATRWHGRTQSQTSPMVLRPESSHDRSASDGPRIASFQGFRLGAIACQKYETPTNHPDAGF